MHAQSSTLHCVTSFQILCSNSLFVWLCGSLLINTAEEQLHTHTLYCMRLIPNVHSTDKIPLLALTQATPCVLAVRSLLGG